MSQSDLGFYMLGAKQELRRPMPKPIRLISFDENHNETVRRLVTGVIHQWDRIPKHVQDDILRDAALAGGAGSGTGSLREQITAFIRSNAGDRS